MNLNCDRQPCFCAVYGVREEQEFAYLILSSN